MTTMLAVLSHHAILVLPAATLLRRLVRHRRLLRPSFRPFSTSVSTASIVLGIPIGLYTYKTLIMAMFQRKLMYPSYIPPNSRHESIEDGQVIEGVKCEKLKVKSENVELDGYRFRWDAAGGTTKKKKRFIQNDNRRVFTGIPMSLRGNMDAKELEESATEEKAELDVVLVYFQGNAGNIPQRIPVFKTLLQAMPALRIISVHPRGYGRSPSSPTQKRMIQDAISIYQHVAGLYSSSSIYLYGHSLGGAVTLHLMEQIRALGLKSPSGIILENTFTRMVDVVRYMYPKWTPYHILAPYLLLDRWDSITACEAIWKPSATNESRPRLLVMVGEKDDDVPPWMGRTIVAKARCLLDTSRRKMDEDVDLFAPPPPSTADDSQVRLVSFPFAGHQDVFLANGYREAVKKFIMNE